MPSSSGDRLVRGLKSFVAIVFLFSRRSGSLFNMEAEQAAAQVALDKFGERLDELDAAMRPVLAAMDEVRTGGGEELPPLMHARIDATLAYALNAIFCMYLRTQGQDPTEHPVREEIARVRAAYVRIHEIDAGQRPRPRKRLQAAVFVAEQELSRVLTDGERALHHAANGRTTPERDVGLKKVFEDSSEESGDAESPKVSSTEKKKSGGKSKSSKSSKRKRKDDIGEGDTGEGSSASDEDVKAASRSAKKEKRRRKQEKLEKKERKKDSKAKSGDGKRRKSRADA